MIGLIASLPGMLSGLWGFALSPLGRLVLAFVAGLSLGWIERGAHDEARQDRAILQAKTARIEQLESDLKATREIGEAAAQRARSEAELVEQLKKEADDYAARLAKQTDQKGGAQSACALTEDDLRHIQSGAVKPDGVQSAAPNPELHEARPARRAR